MASYRVIGTNGHEYGPVGFDQVRAWIAEGRVQATTLLRDEGSPDWRPAATFPEFRSFVAVPAGAQAVPAPPCPSRLRTNPWAVWGFVCGLLSLTLCSCCCLPLDLMGIVFSIIALVQINSHPQTDSGNTLAILGLVLSAMSFAMGLALSAFWMSSTAMEDMLRELEHAF